MAELLQLRETVSKKQIGFGTEDLDHKHKYNRVMEEIIQQRDRAEIRQIEQHREVAARQDALLDKWGIEQAEYRRELKLEREEARRERREAQARQDLFVTKLFEQNEVLSNLVTQQNDEITSLRHGLGKR